MEVNRYARQILAFGEEGQRKIEAAKVGIVGLGGIGSHIAQGLAYLGVRSFVLVDDDRAEDTNLNRLVGAVPVDVVNKTPKVFITERHIRQIQPEAEVLPVDKNLRSREALETLIGCSTIFGCVDHDAPRLILMELAAAYELVLIDSASEFVRDQLDPEEGRIVEIGGRVVLSLPGRFCLDCAGEIDMERAKDELLSSEVREIRRVHGYGLGEQAPAPAVVSLNGVVANLALTEFLFMATNFREPNRYLRYCAYREGDPQSGKVTIRTNRRREDCYTCGYMVGKRDESNIFRYALPDMVDTASK
ncbi:MAG: HesA/MoeB/ThiF family protein [Thermoleophilia bacterium]